MHRPAPRSAPRPDLRNIRDVLQSSSLLAQLRFHMAQSQARLQAILPLLPAPLRPLVKAAGLEDGVWYVLCPNAAVATKLRQLQPRLLAHLQDAGLPTKELRFKIEGKI